jgi:hypothetical protein
MMSRCRVITRQLPLDRTTLAVRTVALQALFNPMVNVKPLKAAVMCSKDTARGAWQCYRVQFPVKLKPIATNFKHSCITAAEVRDSIAQSIFVFSMLLVRACTIALPIRGMAPAH